MPDIGGLPSIGSLAGRDSAKALERMEGASAVPEQVFEDALKGSAKQGEGESKTTKRAVNKALEKMEGSEADRMKAELAAGRQASETSGDEARPLDNRSATSLSRRVSQHPATQERPDTQASLAAAGAKRESAATSLVMSDQQAGARNVQPSRPSATGSESQTHADLLQAPSSEQHGGFPAAVESRRPPEAPAGAGAQALPRDAPAQAAPSRGRPAGAGTAVGLRGRTAAAPESQDLTTARKMPQTPEAVRAAFGQSTSPERDAVRQDGAMLGFERAFEAVDLSGFAPLRTDAAPQMQPSQVSSSGSPPPAELSKVVEEIANRILVSNPADQLGGEVRIELKQSVLEGSDVRIFREHGELNIVVVARDEFAHRMVADYQGHLLRELSGRLPDEQIRMEIEQPRGSQATGREANDGRSRQQYAHPDEHEPQ